MFPRRNRTCDKELTVKKQSRAVLVDRAQEEGNLIALITLEKKRCIWADRKAERWQCFILVPWKKKRRHATA